jgi:hypothetical protein
MVAGKKMSNQQTHWIIIETLDYYSFDFALISPTYTLAKLFYEDVAAGKLITEGKKRIFPKQIKINAEMAYQ